VQTHRAQEKERLDAHSAMTEYTFAVKAGVDVHVHVQLDDTSTIARALISHGAGQISFQTLSPCNKDLPMTLYEGDEHLALVEHADLNFDGFEDLKVLQYVNDHLGKSLFCIYLWDDRIGQFREEPQLFGNPEPDPKNKRIFFHEEYFGGVYIDKTCIWRGSKLLLIAEKGLLSGSSKADCRFTSFCSRLLNGKMQRIEKPTVCGDGPIEEVSCPSTVPALGKQLPRAKR
jgi:hypothetical protein